MSGYDYYVEVKGEWAGVVGDWRPLLERDLVTYYATEAEAEAAITRIRAENYEDFTVADPRPHMPIFRVAHR